MKMYKIFLLIIFTLFLTLFTNCQDKIENIESILIVNNLPAGGKAHVSIHPAIKTKEDSFNDYNNVGDFIALSSNYYSPFKMIWYESISSGIKFIVVSFYPDPNSYSSITKITTAYFSEKGDAAIDWNDMIEQKFN